MSETTIKIWWYDDTGLVDIAIEGFLLCGRVPIAEAMDRLNKTIVGMNAHRSIKIDRMDINKEANNG